MALKEIDTALPPFMIGQRPFPERTTTGLKVLWVTSTGGHLSELRKIEEGLNASDESLWVTFDSPQTQTHLQGRRTLFVDYVAPRDLAGALKAALRVAPLLRREKFDLCVSTGAALAAAILPMAALAHIPTYYIESVTRTTSPSLTGRLLARAPKVHTLAQYENWSSKNWPYAGSLLDGWAADGAALSPRPLKVLVTLGTIRPYRFDRAVNAVLAVLGKDDEVTWQVGSTTRPELPGEVYGEICPERLTTLARAADVVVAHAGVGSILQLFESEISPVVAVRSSRFNEHVDEHQLGFAQTTAARGLTTVLDLASPSRDSLLLAAGRHICNQGQSPLAALN